MMDLIRFLSLPLKPSSSGISTTSLPLMRLRSSVSKFEKPSRKKSLARLSSFTNVDLPVPCLPTKTNIWSALHPGWSARATSCLNISFSTSLL